MKLAIRNEGVMIAAYLSNMDDSERILIATLAHKVAGKVPGAFDAWKEAMQASVTAMLAQHGVQCTGFQEYGLQDKN